MFSKVTKFNDTFAVYSDNFAIFYVTISAKNLQPKISYASQSDPLIFSLFEFQLDFLSRIHNDDMTEILSLWIFYVSQSYPVNFWSSEPRQLWFWSCRIWLILKNVMDI